MDLTQVKHEIETLAEKHRDETLQNNTDRINYFVCILFLLGLSFNV